MVLFLLHNRMSEINTQPPIDELKNAQSIVVVLPNNPSFEQAAVGLGLFLALQRSGKQVEVVCPSHMLVEFNRLVGVQKVKNALNGRNLVISFNYVQDAIEKVSYNVDNGKFNLVVVPKVGHEPLDHKSVSYSYSGISPDATLLIGTKDLKEARGVLTGDDESDRRVISLVGGPDQTLATEAALLLSNLGIIPDVDTATNLFNGLVKGTNNFMSASASDFEVAAALIRAGASAAAVSQQGGQITQMTNTQSQIQEDWLKQPKIFTSREGS